MAQSTEITQLDRTNDSDWGEFVAEWMRTNTLPNYAPQLSKDGVPTHFCRTCNRGFWSERGWVAHLAGRVHGLIEKPTKMSAADTFASNNCVHIFLCDSCKTNFSNTIGQRNKNFNSFELCLCNSCLNVNIKAQANINGKDSEE